MHDPRTGETVPTELEAVLRAAGAERIVICGLATDYCVKATALDGVRLGFGTTVLTNGIRPVEVAAGDGQRALDEMGAAGVRLEPPPA
jgi:nicotinamidase-related amidase